LEFSQIHRMCFDAQHAVSFIEAEQHLSMAMQALTMLIGTHLLHSDPRPQPSTIYPLSGMGKSDPNTTQPDNRWPPF
jgi:hypothetical protein